MLHGKETPVLSIWAFPLPSPPLPSTALGSQAAENFGLDLTWPERTAQLLLTFPVIEGQATPYPLPHSFGFSIFT